MRQILNLIGGIKRMSPPWDSLRQLQDYSERLWWGLLFGGIAWAVITTTGGYWLAVFQKRISDRIEVLKEETADKKELERQAAIQQANRNAEEARKHVINNIPNISGLLNPGDGDISRYLTTKEAKDALARVPESNVVVVLGNCLAWTSQFPYAIVTQGNEKSSEDMITVGRDEEGLWVSAKFFNVRGQIICELVRNRFHLNPGEYFRMEQTEHKITVYDKEARVALDVEFVSVRAIRFLGDFYLRHGSHVAITPQWLEIGGNRFNGYIIGPTQRGAVMTN
jgi:hypothetical protein